MQAARQGGLSEPGERSYQDKAARTSRQVLGAWAFWRETGNIVGLVLMIGLPIAYYYNADFLVLLALTFAFFLAATHAHYALKV